MLKLDKKVDKVNEYLELGLSKRKMAKTLGVAYSTLDEIIEKNGLRKNGIKKEVCMASTFSKVAN